MPFIAQLYPGVPVVPLIVKDAATDDNIETVRSALMSTDLRRTLVVASLDFAHGETAVGAEALDRETLEVLEGLDVEGAKREIGPRIAVDSPPAFRLLLGLMRSVGASEFTLLHHSNSAKESGQLDATDVTSHITGLFSRFPIVVH